jgi:hypothetical protein
VLEDHSGCLRTQAGEREGDEIFYTDKRGGRDHECLSLGCDHAPVLDGRTPLQTYADFIGEFARQCQANDLWGARPLSHSRNGNPVTHRPCSVSLRWGGSSAPVRA